MNPIKRRAVERALAAHEPTVEAVAVDSGVAEQPTSLGETIRGAETRAHRALAHVGSAQYGVGLEGGVATLDGVPGRSLIMWAAVTDGSHVVRGGGPSIRLPEPVAVALEAGEELGPVIDRLYGTEIPGGAISLFTDGAIDRTDGLAVAMRCAFGRFRTETSTEP